MTPQPGTIALADARRRLSELSKMIRSGQRDDNPANRAKLAALEDEVAELEAQVHPPAPVEVAAVQEMSGDVAVVKGPRRRGKSHG